MRGCNQDKENRVGFYTTLIFHLCVLIVMLLFSIERVSTVETSFVLDFTKQEELEKQIKEMEVKEDVKKNLDDILSQNRSKVRNVAVDAGSRLKDDRFKNPNQVYEEAKELQRKLDASRRDALAQQAADEAVDMNQNQESSAEEAPARAYSGPSVISYDLDGRKATSLPVPAYMGYGAGDVTVDIVVNPSGRVISATVRSGSTADASLHYWAIDAAKRSRFAANPSAPSSQQGWILYRFIAQ